MVAAQPAATGLSHHGNNRGNILFHSRFYCPITIARATMAKKHFAHLTLRAQVPNFVAALNNLAMTLYDLNDFAKAEPALQKLIALSPEHSEA